jgi:hypothetical protein
LKQSPAVGQNKKSEADIEMVLSKSVKKEKRSPINRYEKTWADLSKK